MSRNLEKAFGLGIAFVLTAFSAYAEGSKATEMWGTIDSGASTANPLNSAEFHQTGGVTAGQVNAAINDVLFAVPNLSVIGSQTIVQVNGSNNVLRDIDQSAVNSGDQSIQAPAD